MEELLLEGKRFKKASVIAREFGYTSDYVGQLCRGGKIDAQLVGRSWYVDVDSLTAHKENRYRSNTEKTKQAVKETLAEKTTEKKTTASEKKHHNYLRFAGAQSVSVSLNYHGDDAELIPSVKEKTTNSEAGRSVAIAVEHPDARKMNVISKGESYRIETPERDTTSFTGTVTVQTAEDPDYFTIPDEVTTPIPVAIATDHRPANVPKARRATFKTRKAQQSTPAQTRNTAIKVAAESQTEAVPVSTINIVRQNTFSLRLITIATVHAFVLAALVFAASLSLQSTVVATSDTVTVAYSIQALELGSQLIEAFK